MEIFNVLKIMKMSPDLSSSKPASHGSLVSPQATHYYETLKKLLGDPQIFLKPWNIGSGYYKSGPSAPC